MYYSMILASVVIPGPLGIAADVVIYALIGILIYRVMYKPQRAVDPERVREAKRYAQELARPRVWTRTADSLVFDKAGNLVGADWLLKRSAGDERIEYALHLPIGHQGFLSSLEGDPPAERIVRFRFVDEPLTPHKSLRADQAARYLHIEEEE